MDASRRREAPHVLAEGWKDIAVSEHQLATGEEETYSGDEIRARLNENTDAGE